MAARPQLRKTTPEQGHALEILGHAIEYLIDSRMFHELDDREAIHELMCCSRAVFAECEIVVPFGQRVRQGFLRRLHLRSHQQPVA